MKNHKNSLMNGTSPKFQSLYVKQNEYLGSMKDLMMEDSPYHNDSASLQGGSTRKIMKTVRNAFIAPELAYNNDKQQFFARIGYSKQQKDLMRQSISTLYSGDQRAQDLITLQTRVDRSIDNRIFLRKRNKIDDSYYEKRIQTISKSRPRQLYDDEIQNVLPKSQNNSAIKKLMHVRRLKQSQLRLNGETPNLNYNDQSLEYPKQLSSQYNSRTANQTFIGDQIDEIQTANDPQNQPDLKLRFPSTSIISNQRYQAQSFMNRRQNREQNLVLSLRKKQVGWNADKINASEFIEENLESSLANDRSVLSQNNTFRSGKQLNRIHLSSMVNNANLLQCVPLIKGIKKKQLMELFTARCKDLSINPSKDQMVKFFEILHKNRSNKERKMNFSDMNLGINSVAVVCSILKDNSQFSSLDLKKNCINNDGVIMIAKLLENQNNSIVHLDIGCNQMSSEGAVELFKRLKNNSTLVSISIANIDCYKNKNKIGCKGAQALEELLRSNHTIQMVNVSDNGLTAKSLQHIIQGARDNSQLISLNLSQNDIGSSGNMVFNQILAMFKETKDVDQEVVYSTKGSQGQQQSQIACFSLEELILSGNFLTNKHIQDLSNMFKQCPRTSLQRLDFSNNKLTAKSLLSIISALRNNSKIRLTHLIIDRSNLEMGSSQEQVNNFNYLKKSIEEFLKSNRFLKVLSLNHSNVSNDLVQAIGKGLQYNQSLEELYLRQNQINFDGLINLIEAFESNGRNLQLRILDLGSNKINDEAAKMMANSLIKVKSLEQVILRDNNIGPDGGDALLFLAQQKLNLCKLQLEMNMIKYVTILEIEKFCKRNKQNTRVHHTIPGFKQQLTHLLEKKDPQVKLVELDKQLKHQSQIIIEGKQTVIEEEEYVHDVINQGNQDMRQFDVVIKQICMRKQIIDDQLHQLDVVYSNKEKEWQSKINQEELLLEKCREHLKLYQKQLNNERQVLERKKQQRRMNDEELKLKDELEKTLRDQNMMKMIVENYEKEIQRRTEQQESNAVKDHHAILGIKSVNQIPEYFKNEDIKDGIEIKGDKKKKKAKASKSLQPLRKNSSSKKAPNFINNLKMKQKDDN